MKRTFKVVAVLFLAAILSVTTVFTGMTDSQALTLSYAGYTSSRSPTSSYQSGPYYGNVQAVTLTGDNRTDIVNVAKSQVGYLEGDSTSQRSGTYAGSGNYTEYGYWYGMDGAYWCAMFVSWCAYVAGIPESVVDYDSYTETQKTFFSNKGQAYSWSTVKAGGYTPQPGDIVFFLSSGAASYRTVNHIGIVTGYSGGTLYTIEGNTSTTAFTVNGGAVASKSYSSSSTYVKYICSPSYTSAPTYSTGVHEVISSSLNVRDAASTGNVIGSFTTGERFNALEVVSENWGRINYYGKTGYVSLKSDYVEKVADRNGLSHNTAITNPTDIVFDNQSVTNWAMRGTDSAVTSTSLVIDETTYAAYTRYTTATATNDPYAYLLFDDTASFTVDNYNYVSIVAKTSTSAAGKLYLYAGTQVDPTEAITETWNWIADGQWHEYILDISDQSALTGYFNGMRFDYFDQSVAQGATVDVRSIRFLSSNSAPTISVSDTIAVTDDVVFTYSGLDNYIDGEDYRHPYIAVYAEGTAPGNGSAVALKTGTPSYVGASGTLNVGALEEGTYTAYLMYNTAGRASFVSDVQLANAASKVTFTVFGSLFATTGVATGDAIVKAEAGTVLDSTVSDIVTDSLGGQTIVEADGVTAVAANAVICTGMKIVDATGKVLYEIVVAGDVNGSNGVETTDAQAIIQHIRGTSTLEGCYLDAAAEVNGGTINIITVTQILNGILG